MLTKENQKQFNMNMKIKKIGILCLASAVLMTSSCKKENEVDESIVGSKIDLSKLVKQLAIEPEGAVGDSVKQLTSSKPNSRNDLENMRTVIKIYNGEDNAGLTVPGFGGIKLGKEEVNLNVYYIESKVVASSQDTSVYGCGYSVHYLFKKLKRGLSITNLPSVAASAELNSNRTQVFYSLKSYGMVGPNLTRYFKPTINKDFNVEGFGIMQSSIDGIHNVMGDTILSKNIKFTPELLNFVKPHELMQ